jgi:hypothetical protein
MLAVNAIAAAAPIINRHCFMKLRFRNDKPLFAGKTL